MDDGYVQWATELKEEHPETLLDYTVEEVCQIWRDHSRAVYAHWLNHQNIPEEAVQRVFGYYHKLDGKLVKDVESDAI